MGQKLTKGDVAKIEEEIRMRRVELRPRLTAAVAEAAAQGDRSENFEYTAAKRENNRNNSRIRYLENILRTAEIVDSAPAQADEVNVDMEITVYLPDEEEEEVYTLVTPIRANTLSNVISIESPMGKALLHHHVGDTVMVEVNKTFSYPCIIRSIRPSSLAKEAQISAY